MRPLEDEQQKQSNLKDELSEKRAKLVKQLKEVIWKRGLGSGVGGFQMCRFL
jgi:hypothetical protein